MALEIRQQLKLTQQLHMTPMLKQAISLLLYSRQELVEAVQRELLEKFPDVKEYLERYFEAHYGAANEFGFQQFQMGVRVGAQLMLEMMRKVEK